MVRASPRNRSANPGSSSSAGSRIFTATVRPSTSSVPRHTSPIPPPAIRSTSRYRPPSVVPMLTMSDSPASLGAPLGDHGLHDLARDPGRLATAARAGLLQKDGHRTERLVVLVEDVADEPAVVTGRRGVLRCTGLATHPVPGDLRLLTGAVLDDALH